LIGKEQDIISFTEQIPFERLASSVY